MVHIERYDQLDYFITQKLKYHNVGEVEFLDVWHEAYAAIMRYSRGSDGFWVSACVDDVQVSNEASVS